MKSGIGKVSEKHARAEEVVEVQNKMFPLLYSFS